MTKSVVQAAHKTLKKSIGRLVGVRRALMFSGGFDSMLLAILTRREGARVIAVTVQFENFNPLTVAEATLRAQTMCLPHHIIYVTLQEFLSAFGSLPSVIDKPLLDLDLALVHAAFKKYDAKLGGKVFISGMGSDQWFGDNALDQSAIDEKAHHKVAQAHGYKFIFPFLSKKMRTLSQRIPAALKKDKKLLRALAVVNTIPHRKDRSEVQVPDLMRRILVNVFGHRAWPKPILGSGERGNVEDQALRQIVLGLWLQKAKDRIRGL